jgi:hypothetical protein
MDLLLLDLVVWIGGMCAGFLLGQAVSRQQYTRILRLCAKLGTPEKLGQDFYYIVPEKEYAKHTQLKIRRWSRQALSRYQESRRETR